MAFINTVLHARPLNCCLGSSSFLSHAWQPSSSSVAHAQPCACQHLQPVAVLERVVAPPASRDTSRSAPTSATKPEKALPLPEAEKPGVRDRTLFVEGSSVAFWRSYNGADPSKLRENFSSLVSKLGLGLSKDPVQSAYWLYCFGRTLSFFTLGALGVVAATARGTVPRSFGRSVLSTRNLNLLVEAGYVFLQDYQRIRSGVYKMPWDARLRHRQLNPLYAARQGLGFFSEVFNVLGKRSKQSPDISVWLEGKAYPEYYKQTYHFQTDGWLSSYSADVYEVNTETLFLGRQDAMQRLTLCALRDALGAPDSLREEPASVVELAAGTGRFATFVRDNWPEVDYVVSDLSPFYLQKARENMGYWERARGRRLGADRLGSVRYIQACAEDLPLQDASADVVFSIYLFHELPPSARRAVVREAARLLKPGGVFAITDSIQLGDRPRRDAGLSTFHDFQEPWYLGYVAEDLGALVTGDGKFKPQRKELSSVTKMLSFVRTDL